MSAVAVICHSAEFNDRGIESLERGWVRRKIYYSQRCVIHLTLYSTIDFDCISIHVCAFSQHYQYLSRYSITQGILLCTCTTVCFVLVLTLYILCTFLVLFILFKSRQLMTLCQWSVLHVRMTVTGIIHVSVVLLECV